MTSNRISDHFEAPAVAAPAVPSGFAVCHLAGCANPLALQIAAQQQAFEQALIAAREEALRIALSLLQPSLN